MYRYAVWSVIGLAIMTAEVLRIFSRTKPLVGLAVLGVLISILAGQQVLAFQRDASLASGEAVYRALLALPDGSDPIVIGSTSLFMEVSYYCEPRLRERMVYPLSRSLDLQFRGYDTLFILRSALRPRTKLHMTDLDVFLRDNPHFVAAVRPGDHWYKYLLAAGYQLIPLSPGSSPVLYEAEAPRTH